MEIHRDHSDAKYQITAYTAGTITVNGKNYSHGLLIMADHLLENWGPNSVEELSASHFQEMVAYKPQVVLLGTGPTLRFPNAAIFAELYRHQIGVEIMDTAAACRTYTLLISEGRRVIAGLLP